MKKLLSVLLLAALGLSLFACGSTPASESFPGGSVFLDARNGIGLRIVRSDGADDRVILAAMQIRESLCGAAVDLCSAWSRAGEPTHTGPEIHVGVTSCAENAVLLEQLAAETEDCYYIRSVGNKIFLLATGEDLLDEAVVRFLADYVKPGDGGVYIARDISLWVSADGRVDLVRGGVSTQNRAGQTGARGGDGRHRGQSRVHRHSHSRGGTSRRVHRGRHRHQAAR